MRFVIERLIGYRIIQRFDFLKLWLFTLTILSETEGRNPNPIIASSKTCNVITFFKAFDEDRTYRGLPLGSDDENLRGLTHS